MSHSAIPRTEDSRTANYNLQKSLLLYEYRMWLVYPKSIALLCTDANHSIVIDFIVYKVFVTFCCYCLMSRDIEKVPQKS